MYMCMYVAYILAIDRFDVGLCYCFPPCGVIIDLYLMLTNLALRSISSMSLYVLRVSMHLVIIQIIIFGTSN